MREFSPDAEALDATTHDWVDDEYSLGTWATFRAGQFAKYERKPPRPEGRVHFTSSPPATRWRAFIHGAIKSGVVEA